MSSNILIIGAGGVTSHMLPQLLKMCDPNGSKIAIVDGDILEERNLDRQLFLDRHIGLNKASALKRLYPQISVKPEFFTRGNAKEILDECNPAVVFVAVDNHQTRAIILDYLDEMDGTTGIFGVNEYFDSQSYAYKSEWINTHADPRIRYPEITKDKSINPTSCQGEAAESTPQLAIANAMSGCMMMHMFWIWVVNENKYNKQAKENLPYDIRRNISEYSVLNWTE
jgi:hypothetical protein